VRELLNAQGLMLDGAEARRHYRVAHQLAVELQMAYGNVWTNTLDISAGGFSVMLPHAVDTAERPGALLHLPDGSVAAVGDSVTGTGIVMSAEAARQVVGDAPEVGGCPWGDQVRVFGYWASLTVRR